MTEPAAPASVQIESAEVRLAELELVTPVVTAYGVHRHRPIVLVRLRTDLGDAVGECSALAEPDYTSEYAAGAAAVLRDHLLPRLLADGGRVTAAPASVAAGSPLPLASAALARLAGVSSHRMAKASVEMAVADLECRVAGSSLASALGASRATVLAGATVGLGDPNDVSGAVAMAARFGYRRVKVKIAPGAVAGIVRARNEVPAVELAADANGSYRLDEHRRELDELDEVGLSVLEQPLARDDLLGHAELRRVLTTTVVLDESVAEPSMMTAALVLGAAGGVSVKPGRCGGVLAAAAAVRLCSQAGVGCLVGGMFESGLGRAAALAVAALDGVTLAGDLGASDRYFAEDLTAPHVLNPDGTLTVPQAPGLGVQLLREASGSLLAEVRPGRA